MIHRRSLTAEDFTTRHNIPVTTPVCTLIDIAARLSPRETERAVNEADKLDLVDPETLREALDATDPRPGVARLRRLLDYRTFTLTDSMNEQRFVPIARAAGLPKPETQQWVNGYRVDFYWPDLDLVSKRTACATTARRPSRRKTACATRSTPRPGSRPCASLAHK